jgi:hypothetical protein
MQQGCGDGGLDRVQCGLAVLDVPQRVLQHAAGFDPPAGGPLPCPALVKIDFPGMAKLLPAAFRHIALACTDQLEVCRAEARVDWTYLSPDALLEPGKRTGNYRLGTDELLVDAEGNSTISRGSRSSAAREAERPKHHRTRFTAAY